MKLSEKILFSLSRPPEIKDYDLVREDWTVDNALHILNSVFPDFKNLVADKKILDFGCGWGYQSVALIKQGARQVVGLDTNFKFLEKARNLAKAHGLSEKQVRFTELLDKSEFGAFDIVISQNSMEHFVEAVKIMQNMKAALNSTGRLLITFGPPWYAPYGSHMQYFTKLPWVNILFAEKTVMRVRSNFRNDGAQKYEEVESGLAKMSVGRFERLVAQCGMNMQYKKYDCVRGLGWLGKLPGARELFINHVSCALTH